MIRVHVIQSSLAAAVLVVCACSSAQETAAPSAAHGGAAGDLTIRTLVVAHGRGGSYIALERQGGREFPPPAKPTFIDQSSQMFVPGEMIARTHQPVQFRSSEDVLHNVRVIRSDDRKPIFNVATPPWGSYSHTFDEPGIYDVSCDIHTAMRATILVSSSPYATIADGSGRFTFEDVVAGTYTLVAFAEGKRKEKTVQISGSRAELTVP
jgi:plastocyanin